ncbi:MAG: hypothetical protein BRD26_09795 [Bacteroidetes bacterium QH_1_64_81]|nr:MAG: hypothetical protein BRD26_09795 [Bacteroidetes bacterium QH_1_64_81]
MNEEIILESDTGEFTLTTHKVRLTARQFGQASVKSIMLQELTGCEIRYVSKPWLLVLAAIAFIGGLLIGNESAVTLGVVVAVAAVAAYFKFRHQAVVLSSPSVKLNLSLKGMSLDSAVDMIDKVESAKHERMTLGQKRPASSNA